MPKQQKPSKAEQKTRELVEAFDEASLDWGWQRDLGHGSYVATSEARYHEAKRELLQNISNLYKRAARLKGELAKLNDPYGPINP